MQCTRLIVATLASVVTTYAAAGLTPEQRKLNADSFEYAWKAIKDHMWEPMPPGLDWQKVHDQLKPKVEAAATMDKARAVMRDMIGRLKMTHFGIIPADVYESLDTKEPEKGSGGSAGLDLRIVGGRAVVVSVEKDAPAYAAGIRTGWIVEKVAGTDIDALLHKLERSLPDTTIKGMLVTRAVQARFEGDVGAAIPTAFLNAANAPVKLDLVLKAPRGTPSRLGYLPTQSVWFFSKHIGETGYVRFNLFLDPARLSPQFGEAVTSCAKCNGMIIDLRGNPGGIGGMSMGMAGWFVKKQNVRLGTMKMGGSDLKFAITPRAETFDGPLAILVDELTASTAEIFAGGMKDIGRARVFGTRTAGAALPSVIEKLPNGDGFQYAVASYTSEGGEPLEGTGVTPDQEVKLTREALLAGQDPAVDAAVQWIDKEGKQ